MPRLIINLQGSLANPNMALEAAKRGELDSQPAGPTRRIDARAITDLRASGVNATCITLGHVVGPADATETTYRDIECWQQSQPRGRFDTQERNQRIQWAHSRIAHGMPLAGQQPSQRV